MRTLHASPLCALVVMIGAAGLVGCSSDDSNGDSGRQDSAVSDGAFDSTLDTKVIDGRAESGDGKADARDVGSTGDVGDADEVCAPPKEVCGGVCSDLSSDNQNCNGCGNACPSGSACIASACTSCKPKTCEEIGVTCGSIGDGCGHTLDCGTCSPIAVCSANDCVCALTCGTSCVDKRSDPGNCGGCGAVCASGNCTGGACGPPLPCKLPYVTGRAFHVLFYGPNGTAEQPYLPASAAAAIVTVWDETTWRSKTTTDFKAFDLIVIGESAGGCPSDPTGSTYQAALDSASQWAPAVSRVVVSELDAANRAGAGVSGAGAFLKTTLQWLAIGPGTGLYVGPECGTRHLDFMSHFSPAFHASVNAGDSVVIADPGHPSMAASTDGSLSTWSSSIVGAIDGMPAAPWEVVALAGGSGINPVVVARNVSCPCAGPKLPTEALGSMAGCAGAVAFADRATLCGPGARVCSAADWMKARHGAIPTHNYWTDDALNFVGTGTSACKVSTSTSVGGVTYSACAAGATPMRVCGANPDPEGNACNWLHCGYESTTPDEYFGGCAGNTTAGTLCCQ
jgi:hypothetical protein